MAPDEYVALIIRRRDPLERTLTPARVGEFGYAWVCGESALATGGRRLLVRRGMDRRSVFFSGYWKVGAART